MTCKVCNHINELTAVRCINCGYPLIETSSNKTTVTEKPSSTSSFSFGGALIAAIVFSYFAPVLFGPRNGSFNYFELACAMVIGIFGGILGDRLGKLLKSKK